jgi:hypothetical protein
MLAGVPHRSAHNSHLVLMMLVRKNTRRRISASSASHLDIYTSQFGGMRNWIRSCGVQSQAVAFHHKSLTERKAGKDARGYASMSNHDILFYLRGGLTHQQLGGRRGDYCPRIQGFPFRCATLVSSLFLSFAVASVLDRSLLPSPVHL